MLLVATFALRVFSNAVQLIRVRSWAVSSLFVILVSLCGYIHRWQPELMGVLCAYLIYNIALLSSYQLRYPQLCVLISSVALAVLTMYMPVLFLMATVLLLSTMTTLRVFSLKTLLAVFFGFLLPYEALLCWHVYCGTVSSAWLEFIGAFDVFCLPWGSGSIFVVVEGEGWLPSGRTLCFLLLLLYGVIGVFHFLSTSYNDKIRTRMHYITVIMHWLLTVLLLLFTRGHAAALLMMLMLDTSVILAHYFVFSKGWVANLLFWLFIALCLYLTLQNF